MISRSNLKKLGLLALVTIGLTACGQTGSPAAAHDRTANSNSNGGDAPARAQSAPLASRDPGAVVANAMQALSQQKAYRIRSTSLASISGAEAKTSVREFVAPDRMHNIEDGREVVIIGRTMYVKKGDVWQNMGTQMSDMQDKMKGQIQQMSAAEKAEATKGLTADYKSLGEEMLDGIPTAVYEMHAQMNTQVEGVGSVSTTTKFWIGKSDGLFRKEESNGDEAGIKIKITKTYEYDPGITIEAPIP